MSEYVPARLRPLLGFADALLDIARESTIAARKTYHELARKSRGATLRPGPETPLWNELATMAAAHLGTFGAKAQLARILGVPRQRVHEYLVAKTACPDTERTLLLLAWVMKQQTATASPSHPQSTTTPKAEAGKPPGGQALTEARKIEDQGIPYSVTLIPPSLD